MIVLAAKMPTILISLCIHYLPGYIIPDVERGSLLIPVAVCSVEKVNYSLLPGPSPDKRKNDYIT